MADGRDGSTLPATRPGYQWTEIFRCFQVALDPRKLLVAAAGIVAVALGWYLLSSVFYRSKPNAEAQEYTNVEYLQKEYKGAKHPDGREFSADDYRTKGTEKYRKDVAQWAKLYELAGPDGRLSTMPWYEYRGRNPFELASTVISGSTADRQDAISDFVSSSAPTLFEPLVKLLIPVVKVFDIDVSPLTRIYLLLCILWSLLCWAFFGGVITRIAAVQLSGKDRISLGQAVHFVTSRYLSYLLSPVVPLGLIAFATIVLALLGLPALLPLVGDILYVVLVPLALFGGFIMAVLLVGLIGYPLMYTTLSVEGSDTFDALSRAYNYVMQAPWQYLWYCLVAIAYGAAVTLVVVFVASLSVYLGKWAISQTPFNEATNQRPEYLFTYAPESFGWKQLLLHGSPLEKTQVAVPLENGRRRYVLEDKYPEQAQAYVKTYAWYNFASAGVTTFWLVLLFMLMLGFTYSFFWSAMTMIYLLMRRHVDEVELDEVYLDDEEPATPHGLPPAPSAALTPSGTTSPSPTSLPMVPPSPPVAPLPPPAAVSVPAPSAASEPKLPPDAKK
ncbi:hypothetical protein [Limnoglobus roseus]|uniref:Uncharacterized protein n=1 Tax=Limnoglobus roseus TaxID=2598579 RepID=A0A5C1AJW3_9BACT|nr:hypothetical protein [Limnoglobus roseus]QEL18965.1 hypothetical protein PX52LOC_06015 [Limnoglobus roseus]